MAVDDFTSSCKIGALKEQLEFELSDRTNVAGSSGDEKKTDGNVQGDELYQLWNRYSKILPKDHPTVHNIAIELCSSLIKNRRWGALGGFLEALPESSEYLNNETIIRGKIYAALHQKDTKAVYKLIEENDFSDGDNEDLVKVWDEAHYIDETKRTKKRLTPLSRFRVRKRYPPPKSICTNGIRKTNTLPREATGCLKYWLMTHIQDPYPSANEKQQLAKISGLSHAQVKTWFANARRRSKSNSEEFQKKCSSQLNASISEVSCSLTSPPCSPATLPYATGTHHSSYYTFPGEALPHHLDNNALPVSGHGYPPSLQNTVNGYLRHERMESYNNMYDHHVSYAPAPCNNNMRGCRTADHMYNNYNGNNNDNNNNNCNNNSNNNNNNNRFPSCFEASVGPRNYYNFGHPSYYLKQPPEWTL